MREDWKSNPIWGPLGIMVGLLAPLIQAFSLPYALFVIACFCGFGLFIFLSKRRSIKPQGAPDRTNTPGQLEYGSPYFSTVPSEVDFPAHSFASQLTPLLDTLNVILILGVFGGTFLLVSAIRSGWLLVILAIPCFLIAFGAGYWRTLITSTLNQTSAPDQLEPTSSSFSTASNSASSLTLSPIPTGTNWLLFILDIIAGSVLGFVTGIVIDGIEVAYQLWVQHCKSACLWSPDTPLDEGVGLIILLVFGFCIFIGIARWSNTIRKAHFPGDYTLKTYLTHFFFAR